MIPTRLCHLNDIDEGQSLGIDINDQQSFVVVKKYGEIHAYINRCPHLGIRLEWQENKFLDSDGALIECSTHGALFEIDTGNCIVGPCRGDKLTPIELEITDGQVLALLP